MSAVVLIVTGIPGSGKTSILDEALKLSSAFTVVNYGEKMLHEAALQDIERDRLRKLPIAKQQEISLAAAGKIAKEAEGVVIVDTHALIKTPFGYCPGIPQNILRILDPRALIAIESAPSSIHARRALDKARNRDNETIEEIESHQLLNRKFLAASSAICGSLFTFIQNTDKQLAVAVNTLLDLIKNERSLQIQESIIMNQQLQP